MSNNITLQKVKRFGTNIESTLSIGMVWLWLWRFLFSYFCLLKYHCRVNTFIYLEYSTFSSTPYKQSPYITIQINHHTSPYTTIYHYIIQLRLWNTSQKTTQGASDDFLCTNPYLIHACTNCFETGKLIFFLENIRLYFVSKQAIC